MGGGEEKKERKICVKNLIQNRFCNLFDPLKRNMNFKQYYSNFKKFCFELRIC